MKYIGLIALLFFSIGSFAAELTLSKEIFKTQSFIPKTGEGKFDSYLQMNIDFPSVQNLFFQLDQKLQGTLNKENARVEAHITVMTPIEFRDVLEPAGLTIEAINKMAKNFKIQKADFSITCLGKGETRDKKNQTYYLVVKSQKLVELREEIFKSYIKAGGISSQFDPNTFYPHITIGYTSKDLHLGSDGVMKGTNSCWRQVKII